MNFKKIRFWFLLILLAFITASTLAASFSAKESSSRSLRSMARAHMALGHYSRALPLIERAYKIASDQNISDKELSLCLNDLSYVYHKQGMFIEAEEKSIIGLSIQEKVYDSIHPYMAYSLKNLSAIYLEQGKAIPAERTIKRALAIISEYHKPDDRVLAPFNVELAKVYALKGQTELAREYFDKAFEITFGYYGDNNLNTAKVMLALAEFNAETDHLEIAKTFSKKAMKIYETYYGSDHHLISPALLNRAMVCIASGEPIKAEALFTRAVIVVDKTGDQLYLANLLRRIDKLRELG